MSFQPRLWRTALRLEAVYRRQSSDKPCYELPQAAWREAAKLLSQTQLAANHGWQSTSSRCREQACQELERLGRDVADLTRHLRSESRRVTPSVRLLYDELAATAAEFGDLTFEDDELVVTTEPITLEEIALGPFEIRLRFLEIDADAPYRVRALEPNPAATSSGTTHPHVLDERLCAGEGRSAIAAALAEGRLYDFFTVVDRILHTYAVGAAYVELDRWYGVPCHDCDRTLDEDERYLCDCCDETLCADCQASCERCGDGRCHGCLDHCADCEGGFCTDCLNSCDRCRRRVCDGCREDRLCRPCQEEQEDAWEMETAADEEAPSSAPTAV